MFGSIKKTMAVAAVVVAGALAPAVASAADPYWTQNGTALTSTPVALTADGPLTLTSSTGLSVTCNTHITGTIWNSGSATPPPGTLMGEGSISSVVFSPTPCPTNIPNCFATAASGALPWSVTLVPDGLAHRAQVSGVFFTNTFSGAGCPPGLPLGVPISEAGTLNPIVTAGHFEFDGGALNTVSGPLGDAEVTGDLDITSPSGISTDT